MSDRHYDCLRCPKTDWLLVDGMRFRGERNSAQRLMTARECGVLASRLKDVGYSFEVDAGPSFLFVKITDGEDYETWHVMRDYPHYGLVELWVYLRMFCASEGVSTEIRMCEYDGSEDL